MKNKKICLLLSILVVSCLILIPGKQVLASDGEGGQVSVPGKITFESETKEEVKKEKKKDNKEKPKDDKKQPEITGKKLYSVLPKTGEKSSINGIIGLSLLLLVAGFFSKRKVGAKE